MKSKIIVILSFLGIVFLCNFYLKSNSIKPVKEEKRLENKAQEIKTFLKKNTKYNKRALKKSFNK